MTAGHVSVFIK